MKNNYKYFNHTIITLCFIIVSEGFTAESKSNHPYISPTPGEIPILAYSLFPESHFTEEYAYKILTGVKECGFNVAEQELTSSDIKTCLKVSDRIGLKFMARNARLYTPADCAGFVEEFKGYNSLAAWMFGDEPNAEDIDLWSQCDKIIYKLDKSHMVYFNLSPAPYFNGEKVELDDYLSLIERKLLPAVWAYDYYPVRKSYSSGEVHVDRKFFHYLKVFAEKSKKTKRPFWAFLQGQDVTFYQVKDNIRTQRNDEYMPIPTEEFLRFEAFCALGYGAQGLAVWNYNINGSKPNEQYSTASIDSAGIKTSVWRAMQKVLHEVKEYNDVFLGCKVVKVGHSGGDFLDVDKPEYPFGPIVSVSHQSKGLTISQIKNHRKNYIIIISQDVVDSQEVKVSFKKNVKLINENLETVENKSMKGKSEYTFTLPPSGYAIFSW